MFLAFGITFEIPIVVIVLVRMGIVSVEKLKEARPYVDRRRLRRRRGGDAARRAVAVHARGADVHPLRGGPVLRALRRRARQAGVGIQDRSLEGALRRALDLRPGGRRARFPAARLRRNLGRHRAHAAREPRRLVGACAAPQGLHPRCRGARRAPAPRRGARRRQGLRPAAGRARAGASSAWCWSTSTPRRWPHRAPPRCATRSCARGSSCGRWMSPALPRASRAASRRRWIHQLRKMPSKRSAAPIGWRRRPRLVDERADLLVSGMLLSQLGLQPKLAAKRLFEQRFGKISRGSALERGVGRARAAAAAGSYRRAVRRRGACGAHLGRRASQRRRVVVGDRRRAAGGARAAASGGDCENILDLAARPRRRCARTSTRCCCVDARPEWGGGESGTRTPDTRIMIPLL